LPREAVVTEERALEELRTLLVLEEGLGPRAFRRLRDAAGTEEGRRVVDAMIAAGQEMRHDIEDILRAWHRREPLEEGEPSSKRGLPPEEIVASFVELKNDEAEILERAAERAPAPQIASRLREMAARQRAVAERVKGLL
jgi:hypothetical protein